MSTKIFSTCVAISLAAASPGLASTLTYDASNAVSDNEIQTATDDHSVYFNGDSFTFADGAVFAHDQATGAASLTGDAFLGGSGFSVSLSLNQIDWGDVPSGGDTSIEPKVQINLSDTDIDPLEDWTAFEFLSGTLTVIGGLTINSRQSEDGEFQPFTFADGEVLTLFSRPSSGQYGFQIGEGANGKNLNYGLAGWFGFTDQNGTTYCGGAYNICDFNLDLSVQDPPVVPLPAPFLLLPAGLGLLWSLKRRRPA